MGCKYGEVLSVGVKLSRILESCRDRMFVRQVFVYAIVIGNK